MRVGKERTSSGAVLVAPLVCGLLGLVSLAMAVGAVVPPVGDAMGVPGRGVGNMFGYLFGVLFFGGIGAIGFFVYRGRRADTVQGPPGAPLPFDPTAVPPGPGIRQRWLAAVPLMLLATAIPVLGGAMLGAWLSTTTFTPVLRDPPTFGAAFGKALGTAAPTAIVPGLVLLVFLVRRGMFAVWPKACLWTAVIATAPTALLSVLVELDATTLPNASLAAGLVLLNYWIGRATLWVLSRPVAMDLIDSELEIPYFVPGSKARLRIQHDQLRLDRLKARKNTVRKEIRWPDLQRAELTHQAEPSSWQASELHRIDVPAGPVLRIVARSDEWHIPVPEVLGEDLATAISLRANVGRT